jgi:hypothetical protein
MIPAPATCKKIDQTRKYETENDQVDERGKHVAHRRPPNMPEAFVTILRIPQETSNPIHLELLPASPLV